MKFKAVGYRVLIKPDPVETESKGGIILAIDEDRHRVAQEFGTIVDVGPQAFKNPKQGMDGTPWAVVGDRVVYSKYGGKLIKDPDTDDEKEMWYISLNDEDIIAKIEV